MTFDERTDRDVVLLVEDEGALRRLSRRLLERGGYQVIEAATGVEALAIFDLRADEIAIVVTDVVMPGMRGTELAELLGKRRRALPLLFMSGYADDELVRRGVFPENMALLKKPFSQEELLTEVARLLAHAREPRRISA